MQSTFPGLLTVGEGRGQAGMSVANHWAANLEEIP
jgi:hypothetical protein